MDPVERRARFDSWRASSRYDLIMTHPHDEEHAEMLAGGVASIDEDDEDQQVRIVPLGEGDVTRGGSGKETYWDREVLKQAVDDGAFDNAKLLKGNRDGHKDMLEQADPDEIVGDAGTFDYEDGVGPVSETGEVIDDHLEKLVDAGLVEVSPDMWRVLGEYDEELGAYRVEEVLDVPYITILDRGASEGAAIEPADGGVEALGGDVGRWRNRVDELSETLGVPVEQLEDEIDAADGDVDVTLEQLSQLFTLRFRAYGDMFGDEFLDDAVSNLEEIEGISATRSSENDDPQLVAIVDRDAVASLDDLNDQIVSALEDTPFEVHDDYDWIEDVAWEGLSEESDPAEQSVDERAESRAGSGSGSTGSSGTSQNMADPEELQEQLAEVRNERDTLADEKEDLEEQLSEMEEQIETKEDRIEQLEEETEPLVEVLASIAAENSFDSAESIAERYEPSELVESLAFEWGYEEDEEDDPIDIVQEQLAGSPNPRGEGEANESPGGEPGEEELAQAEQLAGEVMTASDMLAADGSYYEYLQQEYDVDATEYDNFEQLRSAVRGEGGD